MTIEALDIHVHHRTGERAQGENAAWKDAQKLFGGTTDGDLATYYRDRNMMAVVFDVDSESSTGERADNDDIVELVARSEGSLIGFATVDPGRASGR